jgi:hypothetical protein
VGVRVGHWLVRLSRPAVYYRIISVFLVVVGIKLCADGLAGLGVTAPLAP